jgi:hypothetical protein
MALMGYWWVYFGGPAIQELMANGYGSSGSTRARDDFSVYMRTVGTMLFILWSLGLGAAASAGVTSEREEDTWISLLTTLLTGPEILRAKMAGAVWGLRALGVVMLLLWTFGLLVGSLHPVGFVAVILEWIIYSAFVAALGTALSLRSRNTTRATAGTVAILTVLNGGYLMCCLPLDPDSLMPYLFLGCSPFVIAISPMTYQEAWSFVENSRVPYIARPEVFELVITCFLSLAAYGGAAVLLYVLAGQEFDHVVDRPRRDPLNPSRPPGPVKLPKPPGESELT